ncbi:MAG: hypothetical protein RLZZ299_2636 [Pseudomonadota bacterium]
MGETRPAGASGLAVPCGALGALLGCVEVAVRAEPRLGLSDADLTVWLACAVAMGAAAGAVVGVLARGRPRVAGALLAAGVAALGWRTELALNLPARDPRMLLGMAGTGLAGAVPGALAGPWLRARGPWVRGAFLVAVLGCLITAWLRSHAGGGVVRRTGEPRAPSVLVVTLDTVRRDRIGPYGHDIATPTLDRLAREGVVFDDAVASAPITGPSHLAMFTGRPPVRTGVVANGTPIGPQPLVWEAFRAAGHVTAGFVAGFPVHGRFGWARGMDVYDDDFGDVPGLERLLLPRAWNQLIRRDPARRERAAQAVLARAVPWIRAHRDAPFFVWVHLYDAHGPYHPPDEAELGPPPRRGSPLRLPRAWPAADRGITSPGWLAMAYDGEIRAVDAAIGALLEALGPRRDDVVVAVLSDHGESLGEHDVWFDHGDDLYDPVLRVPWIVRAPGRATPGLRIPCAVGTLDLAPTLLGLAGLPDTVDRDGTDRTAELAGAPCRPEGVHATTVAARDMDAPPLLHALREDGTKTVLGPDGRVSHYDLRADPFERVDLLARPDAAPAVRAHAAAQAERLRGTGAARRPQDAGARSELEALGYVEPPR